MDDAGERRIALVLHPDREDALVLGERARRWWSARDFEVIEFGDLGRFPEARLAEGAARFAVSLGGDGTLLRTVQLVFERHIPVLGINLGHLGYLTPIEPEAMEQAFEALLAGDFSLEQRMALEVLIGSGSTAAAPAAGEHGTGEAPLRRLVGLNEASIEKTAPGHTIRFELEVDGRAFLTYAADGVLVATPTGSTAYNLSIRGPVLSPQLQALVVTPISPHMLFDRSLVLAADEEVRIQLVDDREALLVVDGGPVVPLRPGDSVLMRAGPEPVPIVHLGRRYFHDVLRHKFNLSDR